jgi:hypothetical protein
MPWSDGLRERVEGEKLPGREGRRNPQGAYGGEVLAGSEKQPLSQTAWLTLLV